MSDKKRVAWLDSLRVLASFFVIISHFSYVAAESPTVHDFLQKYIFNIGGLGVTFFFAISGYLAANSLKYSTSVKEFYRRKVIRIIIPYVAAYIVFGAIFSILALIEPSLNAHSPLHFFNETGNFLAIIIGMLPIEVNFLYYFKIQNFGIIGEWFIGTIIIIYLLAPLLKFLMNKNPFLPYVLSLLSIYLVGPYLVSLQEQGIVMNAGMLFFVRIPEFLLGMILYQCKDKIDKFPAKIVISVFLVFSIYNLIYSESISIMGKLTHSTGFWGFEFAALLWVWVIYIFLQWLNEHFEKILKPFNNFSNISYMAMLIHHVIIYSLNYVFHFETFGFGKMFLFLLLTIFLTVVLSKFIHLIYKPIEEKLIRMKS